MAEKKQTVPYPAILDGFGSQLSGLIKAIQRDSLKPAIVADVRKCVELVYALQQLMTMMYNLHVTNYEIQMKRVVEQEMKLEDLEIRCAGYSERINALETKIKDKASIEDIKCALLDNSDLRTFIRQQIGI